ncbi:lipoyl amidotransferase LIPT1, mitochondrial-like [Liolophura sinensis]|uniref:lipoyl amidotransferase LIPT1, mitochondrial-like n=1 Tax=Liolophura sinensis TaxID=3198878 RepID=UPI0031583374
MWRNESAIVIGRHQNPWLECNVPEARKQGISLVRRKSGGGTVYHDKGNLNCSVLTNRKMYNRKENLDLVVKAIQSKWDIPLVVNSRDDIMMDGLYKISGTAAKLGGKRAYHHFTLLFDAELGKIPGLLQSPMMGSDTKATGSVPSQVMNLTDADRSVDFDSLTSAIAKQYLDKQDGQMRPLLPTEKEFPGIEEKIKELCDSNWTFNKTPKFSIVREFVFSGGSKGAKTSGEDTKLKINVLIDKGRITTVEFRTAGVQCAQAQWALKEVQSNLTERNVNSQLITECVVKVEKKAAFLSHEEKKMLNIDECRGRHHCHTQARCVNTDGSYTCECLEGYEGDGQNCAISRIVDALEYFGIGLAILASLMTALILGWLIRRRRRRSSPLVEEYNPADNPAVDDQGVTIEPIRADVSTPVRADLEQGNRSRGLTPETTSPETSNSGATLSQQFGEATSTSQPLIDTSTSDTEASPDVITPTTSDNVHSEASQFSAHTGNEGLAASALGRQQNAGLGESVGDAGRGSVPSPQSTSQANTALDATLPVIDEIEVWQGSTRTG